jgi:hypothetical protein
VPIGGSTDIKQFIKKQFIMKRKQAAPTGCSRGGSCGRRLFL